IGRVAALLVAAVTVLTVAHPTGRYLLRAAREAAGILLRRRPIAEVAADPATPASTRAKLALVVAAQRFAADSVRLEAGESFTEYSAYHRDTLVLVLSAARRDLLRARSWWFPIVGRVPYKGFFDPALARREAADLEEQGLDTYLRPASAFSTLGWFNDPILPTTLRLDSLDLTDTVIHELLHNTFYARGQAVFNESFANFVGARGAQWFWRSRGEAGAAAELERRWADELLLGAFWTQTYAALDSAYAEHPEDSLARVRARDAVYARRRQVLLAEVGPHLRTRDPRLLTRTRFDNALLLARRIYLTDLDLFEAVHAREGGDLRRTIARVTTLARESPDDPYGALRVWLGGNVARGAPVATPRTGS
ncbi:MAG TPA: aminopeptidase, partial [Gemmatimonadaceae bacterium]|nr:aminopeptidase [Gemmatimonadaceae bacterium]